jgi:hypothetical protein
VSCLQWRRPFVGINRPGTYEFRLFLNGGFTRAATSPTVTVGIGGGGGPTIGSLSPASATAGGPAFTLTVNGGGYDTASVVRWNGAGRPTMFVNATQLQASITAADVALAGTAQVSVSSTAGTSPSVSFNISPTGAPTLSVNATNVVGGANVTVTLANGLGGVSDWIALAATSAPNTSYVQYTYVGSGLTSRLWTVAMPAAVGTYEFRLFLNNGYTRAATSPAVTVTPAAAADVASLGSAQVTVFSPTPGGGTSTSLPLSIVPAPVLSVSSTTVAPGGAVIVTLTGGLRGSMDWLAFAASTTPDTSFLQYVYVGAGVSTAHGP